jgi:hypothetical protein
MANEAGGLDNITVEMVQFGAQGSEGATSGTMFDGPRSNKKEKSNTLLYGVITLFCLLAIGVAAWLLWPSESEKKEVPTATVKQGETNQPSGKAVEKVKKENPAPTTNVTPMSTQPKQRQISNDPIKKQTRQIQNGNNGKGRNAEEILKDNKEEKKDNLPLEVINEEKY